MDDSTLPRLTRARAKLEAMWYESKRQKNDLRSILDEYSSPEYKEIMIQIPGAGLHVACLKELLYQGKCYPAIICRNKTSSFTSLDFPHIPAIGYTSDALENILYKAPRILNRTLAESLQDSDTLYRQPEVPVPIPDYLIPPKEHHHMEAYLAWVEVDFNSEVCIRKGELMRLSTSQLSTAGRSTADLPSMAVHDYTAGSSSTADLPSMAVHDYTAGSSSTADLPSMAGHDYTADLPSMAVHDYTAGSSSTADLPSMAGHDYTANLPSMLSTSQLSTAGRSTADLQGHLPHDYFHDRGDDNGGGTQTLSNIYEFKACLQRKQS